MGAGVARPFGTGGICRDRRSFPESGTCGIPSRHAFRRVAIIHMHETLFQRVTVRHQAIRISVARFVPSRARALRSACSRERPFGA